MYNSIGYHSTATNASGVSDLLQDGTANDSMTDNAANSNVVFFIICVFFVSRKVTKLFYTVISVFTFSAKSPSDGSRAPISKIISPDCALDLR